MYTILQEGCARDQAIIIIIIIIIISIFIGPYPRAHGALQLNSNIKID